MNNSFTALIKKETLHIVRDPYTMLIALMIPIVQMILFGFAISIEVNNVDVAVVAPKITPLIESKVSQIAHNSNITFKGYIPADEVDHTLSAGKALAVVVFSDDYNRSEMSQIVIDGSHTILAQTSADYISQILSDNNNNKFMPGITILYNPQLKSAYNFVPGIMGLIFILLCAMLTSVSIVREKENGTIETLLVSPTRPSMIVISKMIPYFCLALVDLMLILIISRYALNVPLSGSMTALFSISLVYILLALALGLFVSTLVKTQIAALLISGMVFMIPVIMLSGMLFPTENMPDILQYISYIVPARWYIPAMRKTMIEGLDFNYVYTEFTILSVMATTLIIISIKRFNNKLQ